MNGVVLLKEHNNGIQISYNISGLKPSSQHTLRLLVGEICPIARTNLSQSQFANKNVDNGLTPVSGGSVPTVRADANGIALGVVLVTSLSRHGLHSLIGRLVLIDADDNDDTRATSSQIACGVLRY